MSTPDTKLARKQKQKEPKSIPAQTGAERLKIIVRRLPPNLPEDIFWQSVQPWVTDDTITWKTFCPGKLRAKRLNKEGVPARAYIAFKREEQVALFSREYDGHVFRDKAGNETHALVEFAPFQKVPVEKKKVDARNNTIDKDDDYISFLDALKNTTRTESVTLESLLAASQPPIAPTTTPLLEALKAEKSAQKDREAILRNHPHYKDATMNVSSKKEEAKKKVAAAQQVTKQQQQQPPESAVPLSKKAKKAAAAAQKASMQAQDVQGSLGKTQAQAPAKSPIPVTIATPPSRHRPPREPHGHPHSSKGDAPMLVPGPAPSTSDATPPAPLSTDHTAPKVSGPGQGSAPGPRGKGRPMVGLGRHFEAALSGAGVAVAPGTAAGDRKKRDKSGSATVTESAGRAGKHREEVPAKAAVAVSSILQRPDVGSSGGPEPGIAGQRPQSPRGTESAPAQTQHEEGATRGGGGGGRRWRRGRGGYPNRGG